MLDEIEETPGANQEEREGILRDMLAGAYGEWYLFVVTFKLAQH
jgi:hypothetical protein